jgi:primosomal protein N''
MGTEDVSSEVKMAILDDEIARYDRTAYLLATRAKIFSSVFGKVDQRLEDVLKELEEIHRLRDAFLQERGSLIGRAES